MKKLISLIISAAMIAAVCIAGSTTVFATYTGSGTEADPYVVSNYSELSKAIEKAPANNMGGTPTYIRIDGDIDYGYTIYIRYGKNIALDLNQHTIRSSEIRVLGGELYIENGTVISHDAGGYYASPAISASRSSVLTARNVTFHGGSGTQDNTEAGRGMFIDSSEFKIIGCTIISGDSGKNAAYSSALYICNSSGKVYDTTLIRGSGKDNYLSSHRVVYVDNSNVIYGEGNQLSSSNIGYLPPRATKIDQADGTGSCKALGTYQAGPAADIVYSVNISWGSMEFTYTDASEGTWNPETHGFEDITASAWSCDADANKITVTNHSNIAIDVALSYTSETDYSVISGSFTDEEGTAISNSLLQLATAEDTEVADAPKAEAFLKLDGALSEGETAAQIGSVTVTISGRE